MVPLSRRLCGYQECAVVLRFNISKDDLLGIVASRGFEPRESAGCLDGYLDYEINDQHHTSIMLFRDRAGRSPNWFDLEKWTGSETYITGQDTYEGDQLDVSLLLYNSQLSSAYLVRWQRTKG